MITTKLLLLLCYLGFSFFLNIFISIFLLFIFLSSIFICCSLFLSFPAAAPLRHVWWLGVKVECKEVIRLLSCWETFSYLYFNKKEINKTTFIYIAVVCRKYSNLNPSRTCLAASLNRTLLLRAGGEAGLPALSVSTCETAGVNVRCWTGLHELRQEIGSPLSQTSIHRSRL